jgi:hypothetical protein
MGEFEAFAARPQVPLEDATGWRRGSPPSRRGARGFRLRAARRAVRPSVRIATFARRLRPRSSGLSRAEAAASCHQGRCPGSSRHRSRSRRQLRSCRRRGDGRRAPDGAFMFNANLSNAYLTASATTGAASLNGTMLAAAMLTGAQLDGVDLTSALAGHRPVSTCCRHDRLIAPRHRCDSIGLHRARWVAEDLGAPLPQHPLTGPTSRPRWLQPCGIRGRRSAPMRWPLALPLPRPFSIDRLAAWCSGVRCVRYVRTPRFLSYPPVLFALRARKRRRGT